MVATIAVLNGPVGNITKYYSQENAGEIGQYYTSERNGVWYGKGASRLGLAGGVDTEHLEYLLAGFGPQGKSLVNTRGSTSYKKRLALEKAIRTAGIDVTFSTDKPYSVAWSVATPAVRAIMDECAMSAAKRTLDNVESTLPLGRRGKGGKAQVASEMVSSLFLHSVSRAGDPQLHIHCLISNVCHGEDGRWSAVDSRMLHNWTPALGRIFRCHLANEITQHLGFQLVRPTDTAGNEQSWFEIDGVPRELVEVSSTRRNQIVEAVGKDGLSDAKARRAANLKTRQTKTALPDMASLEKQWCETASNYGFNQHSVEHLMHRDEQIPLKQAEIDQAFNTALERSAKGRAHFGEWLVMQHFFEILQDRYVDPTQLIPYVQSQLEHTNQLVTLNDSIGKQRYTTKKYWELEKHLLSNVKTLEKRPGAIVPEKEIEKLVNARNPRVNAKLSEEQQAAVRHLFSEKKAIRSLTGVGGSGKTLVLDVIRKGFEDQGYRVLGAALAGKAAAGLQESSGIKSRTLASYLHHSEKKPVERMKENAQHHARMLVRELIGKKTFRRQKVKIAKESVLIIDESSMLNTETMARVLHQANKANATVILVGDFSQLPSIGAGGPAEFIANRNDAANLETNRRQRHEADRQAVKHIRDGEIKEALDNYVSRGRLKVTDGPDDMVRSLVKTWADNGGTLRPEKHIAVCQTRAEAFTINRACQKQRLAELSSLPGFSVSFDQNRFYSGDRVLFHRAMRHLGVENGFTGTVLNVDPMGAKISVRLDQSPSTGKKRTVANHVITIPLRKLSGGDITLGYAATTHKLQGATVDHSYVLLNGCMTSKEMAYTQITRSRDSTHLFVDKKAAGNNLEALTDAMGRSVRKNLAHDVNPKATIRRTSIASDPIPTPSFEAIIKRIAKDIANHVKPTKQQTKTPEYTKQAEQTPKPTF